MHVEHTKHCNEKPSDMLHPAKTLISPVIGKHGGQAFVVQDMLAQKSAKIHING